MLARIPLAEREQVARALARLYQALQAETAETAGIPVLPTWSICSRILREKDELKLYSC